MATDIVYSCVFKDLTGNDYTVQVCQNGFTGSTTSVQGGATPAVISMMAEGDDKFQHIKATEATLELVSDVSMKYLSLYISPNKTYFVRIYRNTTQLLWRGWINPEYFSEPFLCVPPSYTSTITATDGLAELKNVDFPIPSYMVFKHSMISYIATCLEQIGFEADIYVGINFSATTTADGAVTSRLLEYLYLDYRSMANGETLWTCYDVLYEILSTLNARIYQNNGAWYIEKIDHKTEAINWEKYDHAGTYVSTASVDPVIALTSHVGLGTDIKFINEPAILEVQPAYKKFRIEHEYGNRTNILKSSNFEGAFYDRDFETETELRFWDRDKGTETALVQKVEFDNLTVLSMQAIPYGIGQVPSFTAFITPIETGSPASSYVWTFDEGSTNETEMMNWIYGNGSCHLKFSAWANTQIYSESEPKLRAFVSIKIDCSGKVYTAYFDDNDTEHYEWVLTGDSPVTYSLNTISKVLVKSSWNDVDINLKFPEVEQGNSQTYVGFLLGVSSPNLNQATMGDGYGIYYRSLQLYFSSDIDEDKTETVEHTINDDNILEPETYSVKYAESPAPFDTDGYGLVNKYVIFDSGSHAVNLFGNGETHTLRLTDQIIESELNAAYQTPKFVLRGTIIDTTISSSAGLDFSKVLKDYDDRIYYATGLAYNLKDMTFAGEWVQFSGGTAGEFSDEFSDEFNT